MACLFGENAIPFWRVYAVVDGLLGEASLPLCGKHGAPACARVGGSSSPTMRFQPREFSLPKERFGDGFHARVGFPTRGRGSQTLASIRRLNFLQVGPLFGGHV